MPVEFTYSQYAIPYPHMDNPAALPEIERPHSVFLPDQFLQALQETVIPLIHDYRRAYQKDIAEGKYPALLIQNAEIGKNVVFVPGFSVNWEKSQAMMQETARLISLDLAQIANKVVGKNCIEATAVKPGLSNGRCLLTGPGRPVSAIIEFGYDGTINDAVYLTHETGHFIAWEKEKIWEKERRFPGKDGTTQTDGAAQEVQGFFFQHAFYDPDLHPHRSSELGDAVALHRKAETLDILTKSEKCFSLYEKSRAVHRDDRRSPEGFSQINEGFWLHFHIHAAPYFIASGLWDRFKMMPEKQKKNFLEALYPDADSSPKSRFSLEKTLSIAGIDNNADFKGFMKEAANSILSALPAAPSLLRRQPAFVTQPL